ncbi:hypothetical protein D7D25_14095 [Proteiniphilum sp. X52]|nr:hypothetical protein D7D25_14095 [Proteiniphilum sp. X52]
MRTVKTKEINMKKNTLFTTLLIGALCFMGIISCKPDYETDFEVKELLVDYHDRGIISFPVNGGEKEIPVKTNLPVEKWNARSNAEWCRVEKNADKVTVSATTNNLYMTRTAKISIAYGHQEYTIEVSQSGNTGVPSITIEGKTEGTVINVTDKGGVVSVTASSEMNIDYVTPDFENTWIKLIKIEQGSGNEQIITLQIDTSFSDQERTATVTVQSSEYVNQKASFSIAQDPKVWVQIPLTSDMLSANATQENDGHGLPGLVDGVKNTFYHTLWSKVSPGGKPHFVQMNLNEPVQYLRIAYSSRHNGDGGGDVTRAGIWVSESGKDVDSEWFKAATVTFPLPSGRAVTVQSDQVAVFDTPCQYIRFVPEARRNKDPLDASNTSNGWWNMGELYLYTFSE